MDIEKLKKARKKIKTEKFPISDKELCDRYQQVYTGAVNDVLREEQLLYQTLPTDILPLRDEMKVAGIAFTIKGAKNLTLKNEMEERAEMLEALYEDSVCIWDTSEDDESAQWGEVMTMASKRKGCRGAVVDGGVRDTDRVLTQDFPVFCKYRTSNGMLGRFRMIAYQIPIKIGDVTIFPGDVIFGDIDGVIVIPREIAYHVLLKAEKIKKNEREIKKWIVDGLTATEVVEKGGYF